MKRDKCPKHFSFLFFLEKNYIKVSKEEFHMEYGAIPQLQKPSWNRPAMTWTVKCGKEERHLRLEAHNTKDWQIALCVKRHLFLFLISPIKQLQRHWLWNGFFFFFSFFLCQTVTFRKNSCQRLCLFYIKAHSSWWYRRKGLRNFFFFNLRRDFESSAEWTCFFPWSKHLLKWTKEMKASIFYLLQLTQPVYFEHFDTLLLVKQQFHTELHFPLWNHYHC